MKYVEYCFNTLICLVNSTLCTSMHEGWYFGNFLSNCLLCLYEMLEQAQTTFHKKIQNSQTLACTARYQIIFSDHIVWVHTKRTQCWTWAKSVADSLPSRSLFFCYIQQWYWVIKIEYHYPPAIEWNSGFCGILFELIKGASSECISTYETSLPSFLHVVIRQL